MVLLRPIWHYCIQLWGSAKPSNTRTIQAFKSICLRLITGAPLYITNESLHKHIRIPALNNLAMPPTKKHTKLLILTLILYSLIFHPNKFQITHPGALKVTGGIYFFSKTRPLQGASNGPLPLPVIQTHPIYRLHNIVNKKFV